MSADERAAVMLSPAERIALTVARAQISRGEQPTPNVAAMCVMALDRINTALDAAQPDRGDADGEGLSEDERDELLAQITWRLHHYGPIDAEPFRYSRHESPAHAALSAVEELLAARARPASADTGRGEAERALERVRALAAEFEAEIDWSSGRWDYGDNAAWQAAADRLRAALTTEEPT